MNKKFIKHYGTPRRSGRYPWGSGKYSYQRSKNFLGMIDAYKKQGMNETDIAKALSINTTDLRERSKLARLEIRAANVAMAIRLKDKGYSNTAIAKRMEMNESSVRSLLDPILHERSERVANTAKVLKEAVDNKTYIDVGFGVESRLGIPRTQLDTAIYALKENGYELHSIKVEQLGTGKFTELKVLVPPGTTLSDVQKNRGQISLVDGHFEKGVNFHPLEYPISISSDRIRVRYNEEGGGDRDGLIELRPGVDDISLGNARYAQVRIGVDDTHFMKGMALYNPDLPSGVDIIYNSKKTKGALKSDVFKVMETDDPNNPFGASVRQKYYIDADGKKKLSALNIVYEEGDWATWSRNLSSQVLSKQTPALAKKQLDLDLAQRYEEFDEMLSLTNPGVKKALLLPYADAQDSAAVHLQAAALPRQSNHVILPVPSLKPNEIYAPNYRNGESVILIRHPHGGIFEIPQLTVNNRHKEAKNILGRALDAVGIHPKTAQVLSGADFDGDTVIVIPNKNKLIKFEAPLVGLKNFDPRTAYPGFDGMKVMKNTDLRMGDISNLITDMTIKGANQDEIARAVRHSMVVIDAEKHGLNYMQSYNDNNIAGLKTKYQGSAKGGASTVISKVSSPKYVDERYEGKYVKDPKTGKIKKIYIDPETGEKVYTPTGRTKKVFKRQVDSVTGKVTYIDTGKIVKKKTKSTKGAEEVDIEKLSSGTAIESIYAQYANKLKELANRSRLAYINTKDLVYSKAARTTYEPEVNALNIKLLNALKNKPLERLAQVYANQKVSSIRRNNKNLSEDDLKKIKAQALEEGRRKYNAKKPNINITDREWEAIQAGAISATQLSKILGNTDLDALKVRATPRITIQLSTARLNRARAMLESGYTQSEVADVFGISVGTLNKAISGEG